MLSPTRRSNYLEFLQRSIIVTDYGADPTGTKDSTTAIQNALNSGYKEILIPQGTYLISSPLLIPDGVHIFGAGMPDPSWSNPASGSRIKANAAISSIFTTSAEIQVVKMERLFLDGNALATRGISIPYLINQMGSFENLYIHNAMNEQFYYAGNTGNFVVLRNSVVDGGTKGVVCDGADWLTVENVFASNQTEIPFHHTSGTHCLFDNCHAYITQNTVTACFQSDATNAQGECHLNRPTIENHISGTFTIPVGFNAPNAGVHTCYMWRNLTGSGSTGITTVFSSNWSFEGLSQGWAIAEDASGSGTQYDISYNGMRTWSLLPNGIGISRGNIFGSPTSTVTLTTAGVTNPSGGARNGMWCTIPATSLPAANVTQTYPVTSSVLNNDVTQAYLVVPYSGFSHPNFQFGIEIQPSATGFTVRVTPYQYPASGTPDLVFLILFGV